MPIAATPAVDYVSLHSSITQQRAHGATPGAGLEWWYFTGPVWLQKPEQAHCSSSEFPPSTKIPDLGTQITFFAGEQNGKSGVLAQAAESFFKTKEHQSSMRAELVGLDKANSPFAWLSPGFLDVGALDWRLVEIKRKPERKWTLQYAVGGSRWLFDLDPGTHPWLHGTKGVVQKLGDDKNFYETFPFVAAQGVRVDAVTGAREPACASFWFDHEVGVNAGAGRSWNWFALRFPGQVAFTFYELSGADGSKKILGELRSEKTSLAETFADVKLEPGAPVCLKSKRCYPLTWTIIAKRANGKTDKLTVAAVFPEQEVAGELSQFARIYWEGAVQSTWQAAGAEALNGLGYMELVQ